MTTLMRKIIKPHLIEGVVRDTSALTYRPTLDTYPVYIQTHLGYTPTLDTYPPCIQTHLRYIPTSHTDPP